MQLLDAWWLVEVSAEMQLLVEPWWLVFVEVHLLWWLVEVFVEMQLLRWLVEMFVEMQLLVEPCRVVGVAGGACWWVELVVEACWAWLAAALEMVVEVAGMGQDLGEACLVAPSWVVG